MSQKITLKALKSALKDDVRCFSVTGGWGYGKTYLVDKALNIEKKKFIEISLFGIESMQELRKTIVTDITLHYSKSYIKNKISSKLCSSKDKSNRYFKLLTELTKNSFSGVLSASTEFIVQLIRDNIVIIFEDVERAEGVGMKSFLGLVEAIKNKSDAKIILVLNDEKLDKDNKRAWKTFREKILDREIPLTVDSSESAKYVISTLPDPLTLPFLKASNALDIKNIRALKKISNDVVFIYNLINIELKEEHYRLIHTTFIFSALHWDLLGEGVDINKIIMFFDDFFYRVSTDGVDSKELELAKQWESIFNELNISVLDEFETKLLRDFFNTGYFNQADFIEYLNKLNNEDEHRKHISRYHNYWNNFLWNQNISSDDLLLEVKFLVKNCQNLSPRDISTFINHIQKKYSDASLINEALICWEASANKHAVGMTEFDLFKLSEIRDDIADILRKKFNKENPMITLKEAVINIGKSTSWTNREVSKLAEARKDDFLKAFKLLNTEELKKFIWSMDKFHQGSITGHNFRDAVNHYRSAINELRSGKDRLSIIINNCYKNDLNPS